MTFLEKTTNITDFIPHRYENILLDCITKDPQTPLKGTLDLKITENDPLNRHLFYKISETNQKVLITPFYMEIIALAAIVIYNNQDKNKTAIFASISNFEFFKSVNLGDSISGEVEHISSKKGFIKCGGTLKSNGKDLCSGVLSAFFVDINQKAPETKPTEIEFPQSPPISYNKTSRNKETAMIICDALLEHTNTSFISSYTYNKSHPLTKGHFPNNPIMMGVMQWLSVEDSLCHYLETTKQSGNNTYTCNVIIYNQKKIKIADIKNTTLESWINQPNILNQTTILKTGKINFRNMIKPNDTLYIVASDITKL
jgi:3-hydroxymyristoyl/3-hydroxydecanoyl-(acyl carrier protein) dehydratase